jgi:hypothetical protein
MATEITRGAPVTVEETVTAQTAEEDTIVTALVLIGSVVVPINPLDPGTGYAVEESAPAQTATEETSTLS